MLEPAAGSRASEQEPSAVALGSARRSRPGVCEMLAVDPNWAEKVTAIGTAIGAVGLLGAIGAAVFAAQQVREARQTRQAGVAADFLRRGDEDALVETRSLVAQCTT